MSGVHVLLPDPWRRGDARLSQSEEVEALYIRYIGNHMDGVFEAVISQRTLGVNFPPPVQTREGLHSSCAIRNSSEACDRASTPQ